MRGYFLSLGILVVETNFAELQLKKIKLKKNTEKNFFIVVSFLLKLTILISVLSTFHTLAKPAIALLNCWHVAENMDCRKQVPAG